MKNKETNFKKLSFKFFHKLILIFGLVGLLPIFLSLLFSSSLIKNYLQKSAISNLERINEIVSAQIENLMSQGFNNILVLAQNPILTSKETSIEEKKKELEKIYRYYQLFSDITILDERGKAIISTAYHFYGRWETNAWFLKAKKEKQIVASDIYAVIDPKEPILAFFAPILDKEGKIKFFIVTQVNLNLFFQLLNIRIGERGSIFLVSSRGDIIIYPKRELLFEKISPDYPLKENSSLKKGITKFNFQGEKLICSFKVIENYFHYPGHNWHLIVAQPEKEIFALLNKMKTQIYLFSIFVIFLILLISFILSQQINRPLNEIVLVSQQIIRGNLDVQIMPKTQDEFGLLAESFNKMIQSLKKSYSALEDSKTVLEIRVKARTKELEELAQHLEQKVEERTKELEERIEELEKFHQMTVGRELKMLELKEEIERLKKKNAKLKERLKKYEKNS